MQHPIIVMIGTRPEGIKMLPIYFALKKNNLPVLICSSTQHTSLLDEVFELFKVKPDFELSIMQHDQDLFHITTAVLERTKQLFKTVNPSLVLVQGDTTTTMAAALSAFYLKIPIGHVEAGLRTYDSYNPYPEEANRRMVASVSNFHFAPTPQATAHLFAEGINHDEIFCTGNTVVDALRIMRQKIAENEIKIDQNICSLINRCKQEQKKIVLVTAHRRESFNGGIDSILQSVHYLASTNPDIFFVYPYHPNPAIKKVLETVKLQELNNVYVSTPLAYKELIYILMHADLVATDSGGIQEEAISLGKHVLVLREKTERMEGIWAGYAKLVGTNKKNIISNFQEMINTTCIKRPSTIYGDGYAADTIVEIIKTQRMPVTDLAQNQKTMSLKRSENKYTQTEQLMQKPLSIQ